MAAHRVTERYPLGYAAALAAVGGLAILFILTWFGWGPVESWMVFLLSNAFAVITVLVVATLGGAFVGMLVAHRILESRDFSPFERSVMESLQEMRAATERLERTEQELLARLDALERDGGE